MEPTAIDLHEKLRGSFNMYLIVHRGTGRSTRLSCSTATNLKFSTWENDDQALSVGKCGEELAAKYGDVAMFSTTSVAKDIASFMGEYTNGEDTIVFGQNYGAVLGERLMHLNPPEVTGYVFDGITTTAWTSEYPWDQPMTTSQIHEEIAARFKKKGLEGVIKRLIAQFDKNPESICAVIINSLFNNTNASKSIPDSPSFVLRVTLGVMLFDSEMRKMIPPIVYRLNRCADEDLDVLKHFTQVNQNAITADAEDKNYQSPLLNIVIYYSEMWQMSRLSMTEIKKRYADVLISNI
ncbi:Serine protease, partial [Phytophthora megakarya]